MPAGEFADHGAGERVVVGGVSLQKSVGWTGNLTTRLAFEGDDKIGVEDQFHGLSSG